MANESELSKLQAVKELIFGQEIQNYDAEFKEIHASIDKNETVFKDQQKTLDNLEKRMVSRIDKLELELMKKITSIDNKKADRAKLGKLLIQIGEKLQDN